MWNAEKLLKLVVAMCGLGCMCGLPAMFMPRSWMAAAHEWLGMKAFPKEPIAEYLARLTSGMYALFGLLLVVMAADVRRYERPILVEALALPVIALSAGLICWPAGIPKWWIIGDISSSAAFAVAVVVLQHRVRAAEREHRR